MAEGLRRGVQRCRGDGKWQDAHRDPPMVGGRGRSFRETVKADCSAGKGWVLGLKIPSLLARPSASAYLARDQAGPGRRNWVELGKIHGCQIWWSNPTASPGITNRDVEGSHCTGSPEHCRDPSDRVSEGGQSPNNFFQPVLASGGPTAPEPVIIRRKPLSQTPQSEIRRRCGRGRGRRQDCHCRMKRQSRKISR